MPNEQNLAAKEPKPVKALERKKLNMRTMALVAVAIVFALAAGSATAYQVLKYTMKECTYAGDGEICFDFRAASNPAARQIDVKNLDPNKKYKMVINKKEDGRTIEVGSVEVDLNKVVNGSSGTCLPHQTSSDKAILDCCGDLVKQEDYYGGVQVCCKASECSMDRICVADGYILENEDKICRQGSWVNWTADPNPACTDSDGGNEIYKKGHLVWSTQGFQADDKCSGDSVVEYWCEGDMYRQQTYPCANGCEDGACKEGLSSAVCYDTDGGFDYYTKGTVRASNTLTDDYCDASDPDLLMEQYCSPDAVSSAGETVYKCPYGCENGACKPPAPGQGTVAYGEMCGDTLECNIGYECKNSGRYPGDQASHAERYCCLASECASVIPEGPGSADDQPYCVVDSGTDQYDGPNSNLIKVCNGGEYTCYAEGSRATSAGELTCCGDLAAKADYYNNKNTVPSGYSQFVCCKPGDCALDSVCFGENHVFNHPDGTTMTCTGGEWQ